MTKILVIEDEDELRQHIVKLLQYEGYQAISADNGRIGISLAKKRVPDLIVCDVLMPKMSGFGVLSELRSDQLTANIPFIFLTAISTKEDVHYGMQLGADDYLTKPLDADELLSAIRSRLKRHAAISEQMYDGESNYHRQRRWHEIIALEGAT